MKENEIKALDNLKPGEWKKIKEKEKQLSERDRGREQKWAVMASSWAKFSVENPSKVKERIRKGIPDSFRGTIWMHLLGVTNHKKKHPNTYSDLAKKDSSSMVDIVKDLERTFPNHFLFRDDQKGYSQGKLALMNTLKAYSLYDTKVGYCQGMGFPLGLFLMYVNDEENAFWMMSEFLWGEKTNFNGLYSPMIPLTHLKLYQFDSLLKKICPKLYQHLHTQEIKTNLFATQWFMTFFMANLDSHFEIVLRVMDILLYEGDKILFRVGLHLLKCMEKELLTLDSGDLMVRLKVFENEDVLKNVDKFIEDALKIDITTEQLKKLAKEYKSQTIGKTIEHLTPRNDQLPPNKQKKK